MLSLGPGRVSWDAQVEELLDVDSQLDNGLKNGSIDTWQLQEVQAYVATLAGNFAVYIRERDARQECARQLEMRGRADSRLLQELQYVFDQQHVDKEDLAPLEDVIDVYSEVIQKFGNVFNRHQQT